MYVYDEYDQTIVDQRVAQFRGQTDRFLAGKLTEGEFLPLRLPKPACTFSAWRRCCE